MPFYSKFVFSTILWNSFNLNKAAVGMFFQEAEFDFVVNIELEPSLATVDFIFAQNFGTNRGQLVIRTC